MLRIVYPVDYSPVCEAIVGHPAGHVGGHGGMCEFHMLVAVVAEPSNLEDAGGQGERARSAAARVGERGGFARSARIVARFGEDEWRENARDGRRWKLEFSVRPRRGNAAR